MGEIRLFHRVYGQVFRLENNPFSLEDPLHEHIEDHLVDYLGVHRLARKVTVGSVELDSDEKGQIDTLGIDKEGRPVVIEYKRDKDKNVVQQAIDYRDWLLKNKAMFELMVTRSREEIPEKVVWRPRIVIIAGDFEKENDRQAKREEERRKGTIELVRYRRFGDNFLTLEWVFPVKSAFRRKRSLPKPPTDLDLQPSDWNVVQARQELCDFIASLGRDVEVEDELTTYTRFDRKGHQKSFATVRKDPSKVSLFANVGLDPTQERLVKGFIRDVRSVNKRGIGDLEIRIRDKSQFKTAKDLLSKAYRLSR